MTIWVRGLLWVLWLAVVGWCWHGGLIGTGAAFAGLLMSLLLFALPGLLPRRRRSSLQYVEMVKQPVGLL